MKRLIASCFGLGWLPFAPGSWGSLPPVVIFALMCYLHTPGILISVMMAALALVGSVICVRFTPAVITASGKIDPPEVVLDEVAGQAITLLAVPLLLGVAVSPSQVWATAAAGFLLFRAFDTIKPWPARKFEKFPAGWGVLADDLMAGVYAGVALLLCIRFGWVEYFSKLFYFDSRLNIFSACLLGTVQGLTEFLPVSSDGHLVLFETFLKLNPETPQMLLFDLAAHLGTLVVILVAFRKPIAAIFRGLSIDVKSGVNPIKMYKESPSMHVAVLVFVVTIVTGVIGVLLKKYFISARGSLTVVALMWLINGTLLLITDWRKKTPLELQQLGLSAAVLIGLAQAAAIMPAISRSGTTICAAILIGLRRQLAVEFSFLIAIPAILGAAAIELVGHSGEISSGSLPISSLLTGSIVAAFVGALALNLLIKAVKAANLKFFGFYCYVLACFVLIYLLRRA
ncbi:MAG: phosphatidylglycerophosphatase A [Planctomycetota bacterium]|nr:phosphatidylglycerophosphatase A [Planctomycetota bacterium]